MWLPGCYEGKIDIYITYAQFLPRALQCNVSLFTVYTLLRIHGKIKRLSTMSVRGKKKQKFILDGKAQTSIHKTIQKHFFFLINIVIVTACLIFLLWVNMGTNYRFICVELTLWSTHRGFLYLHYLDICHKNMHGMECRHCRWQSFRFIVKSFKIAYALARS